MEKTAKPIRLEELRPGDADWQQAWELYEESFPYRERRNAADHLAALSDPLFHAEAIRTGTDLAGLLYYWDAPDCTYVEHLAVAPALRGQNIGSRSLEILCRRAGRVILEIDPPEDEISVRRLHFYQRLGFIENTCPYVHPSFSRPFDPHPLVLMSYPDPIDAAGCASLVRFVADHVLKYSGHSGE